MVAKYFQAIYTFTIYGEVPIQVATETFISSKDNHLQERFLTSIYLCSWNFVWFWVGGIGCLFGPVVFWSLLWNHSSRWRCVPHGAFCTPSRAAGSVRATRQTNQKHCCFTPSSVGWKSLSKNLWTSHRLGVCVWAACCNSYSKKKNLVLQYRNRKSIIRRSHSY